MFALLFSCYGDFSLLSPLEFFVDPKVVDGRLLCDTFFLQLIAPDDNSAVEVIPGVTDLFPACRNVIVGVKVIPLFVDHLATGLSDSFHLHFDTISRCYPSSTGPLSVPVRRFADWYHFPVSFPLVSPSLSDYTLSYKSELQNFSLSTSSCHFLHINCIALFCYITQGLQAVTEKVFCLKNEKIKILLKVKKKQYSMIE